jgi:hypothetical protein
MVADDYRQQSTKSGDGNGGCNGDSNNNCGSSSDGNGNGVTATATTINNKRQQKKWRRSGRWRQQWN